jgi:lipoprotein-releasing system ATP-binding protein
VKIQIEARGVGRTLAEAAAAVVLVQDVNLIAAPGEFVAIQGPSGCGKSSLLYLLGLLDRPTCGDVFIDGLWTSALTGAERTRLRLEKIGFVFQFHFLLPEFTALENVCLPMRKCGKLSGAASEARALQLLDSLGIGADARKRPDKLSGGQRQRVAIARCLANDPLIILGDEPTGNLDSGNARVVVQAFQRLAHEEGRTIICVTHDAEVAASADRRILMRDAKIISDEQNS